MFYPADGTQRYPRDGSYPGDTGERDHLADGGYPGSVDREYGEGDGYSRGERERRGPEDRGYSDRTDEWGYLGGQCAQSYPSGVTESGNVPPSRPPVDVSSGGDQTWHKTLRVEWPLAVFCVCIAAIALLYNLFGSPDILYDEAAYTWAAQQVAQGWHLTLDNQPLFVHPPLMFLLQAGWLRVTGQGFASVPSAIRMARVLAATVGVVNVLLVASMAYKLAFNAAPRRRRIICGIVAVLTALDPVLVRYDRQNVIEPFALCMSMIVLHAAWNLRRRPALVYVSTTSLLIGLALITNQITIFLVIIPLLYASLERDGQLIRRSAAALGIGLMFSQTFLLWGIELGLGGTFLDVQTATLRRLVGLVQITGLNMPGVSLVGSLERSVSQYSSSYIVIIIGFFALVWCWTRANNEYGKFLAAWLTASYAFGAYIAAVGTLNEQFFVYLLPATIVGTVMLGDAAAARWSQYIVNRSSFSRHSTAVRIPVMAGALGCGIIACISTVSWVTGYTGPGDGVVQIDRVVATKLPACSVVNASGDPQKYSYLLNGHYFSDFSVGPAALASGVHYFILAPTDAVEQSGNMSPALADWIQANGKQLYKFPSQVYKTVQLWYVPASPYDPVADIIDINHGVFINTAGSDCGGYTVTDSSSGSFYSGYQALGGKSVLGAPLGRAVTLRNGNHEQLFDGAVLSSRQANGSAVQPVPIVAMLANSAPSAYRRAGLPEIAGQATEATRRSWLTNSSIRRAYLGGDADTDSAYLKAVQRYGEPLGSPTVQSGGTVSQAFADVVLEVSPGREAQVHTEPVTKDALAAGLLQLSVTAQKLQAAPSNEPNPLALGRPEPTSIEPFVLTLAATLALFGLIVVVLALDRRRPRSATQPNHRGVGRRDWRN